MGDWANLPWVLLAGIEKRLSYADLIRFRAVCLRWRSLIVEKPKLPVSKIPWLMLPFDDKEKGSIYSLVEEKVYPLELPEASGMLYRGSSCGWLVGVHNGFALKIVNPLTRKQVYLPPASTLPNIIDYSPDRIGEEYYIRRRPDGDNCHWSQNDVHYNFIHKVVLSPCHMSSRKNEYTVAIIYGEFCTLAFSKHGDTRWTAALTDCSFVDALFHEGRFYGLTGMGLVVSSTPDLLPKLLDIKVKCPFVPSWNQLYLVGIVGGLLMVERRFRGRPIVIHGHRRAYYYRTTRFRIYKLDLSTPRKISKPRWFKIKSLDNDIMFLGFNSSFLVSTHDFPGLKGNCIYFTDDNKDLQGNGFFGGYDVGVFDLEDGTIKKLPGYAGADDSLFVWPPPTWVTPSC